MKYLQDLDFLFRLCHRNWSEKYVTENLNYGVKFKFRTELLLIKLKNWKNIFNNIKY